ncbi:VOC family protein [Streptomyces sp. Y7]|uniref:VOC family protein n=1 Tax=Streptomyces sp. Y7 TaxID=3342392 RepID=UPI00371121B1
MSKKKFEVGGVELDRPFKARRLNHFGINVEDSGQVMAWYRDVLGFKVTDIIHMRDDFHMPAEWFEGVPDHHAYFLRHNSDHHTFVIIPRAVMNRVEPPARPDITINQITWQVGSLREVVEARLWLESTGQKVNRYGRDPGSNWHTYFNEPTGHINELEYGIEQIGWNGLSKPAPLRPNLLEHPPLPTTSEGGEIVQAIADGVDLDAGHRWVENLPLTHDVGGVLLAQPFKAVRIGPVSIFVEDVEASERFYTETIGLKVSEETVVDGRRCVFLRANTEHHTIGLFPIELRAALGLSDHSTLLAFGVQLGSYQQLRDSIAFLQDKGAKLLDLPQEIHPGIDYTVHAVDPSGHLVQLYYYMEQIGWDGKPRPADQRLKVQPGVWPETVPGQEDTYGGETFWGPLG